MVKWMAEYGTMRSTAAPLPLAVDESGERGPVRGRGLLASEVHWRDWKQACCLLATQTTAYLKSPGMPSSR